MTLLETFYENYGSLLLWALFAKAGTLDALLDSKRQGCKAHRLTSTCSNNKNLKAT